MLFKSIKFLPLSLLCILSFMISSVSSLYGQDLFIIDNKTYSRADVEKENFEAFYEIKKQEYDLVSKVAKQKYLDKFFQDMATKQKKPIDQVREEYIAKKAKISSKEENDLINSLKDHPQFKALPKKEQQQQARAYLTMKKSRSILEDIVNNAIKSNKIKILLQEPEEPVYNIDITEKDNVRYSNDLSSIKPIKCSQDCPITIVEYSEFQCPYCSRTIELADKLLKDFKGKIRWIVRDFPLDFHEKARGAAVAAHCAAEQGKYWFMYKTLFSNQRNLNDKDLEKYASKIKGLDLEKWKTCVKEPKDIVQRIDSNIESGMRVSVNGTPTLFLNGKKIAAEAFSYDGIKTKIQKELKNKK